MTHITLILLISGLMLSTGCNASGDSKWSYSFDRKLQGTRSEHMVGRLFFAGIELNTNALHVITPIGEYHFLKPAFSAGNQGWLPCYVDASGKAVLQKPNETSPNSRRTQDAKEEAKPLTTAEVEKGFYFGGFDEKQKGTPSTWYFSVSLNAWIDPAKGTKDIFFETLERQAPEKYQ